MSTLTAPRRPVNSAPATVNAVAWHALLKAADKSAIRDDLPAGSAHSVDLTISGSIDDLPFEQTIAGLLTVGHDSTKASSANPSLPLLIGNILAQLNEATRNAVLRNTLATYSEQGHELPEVSPSIAAMTAAFLKSLRAANTVDVRGPVKYVPAVEDAERASGLVLVG